MEEKVAQTEEIDRLRALAFKDELTGLFNRRFYNERLIQEFSRAKRYGRTLSLLMMDVDYFKSVNDTFGHAAGDEVLKRVAVLLNKAVRDVDMVFRYAGDEFVVLLPETPWEFGLQVAQRIVEFAKKETVYFEGVAINFTMSVGMASFPMHAESEKELYERADAALYQCKLKGRSRAQMFNPDENELVSADPMENDIFKIGRENELKLLESGFQAIKLNHGKTIVIIGDEGAGKSSLVKVFQSKQQKSSRMFFLNFNCNDSGLKSPYLPIKEAISKLLTTQYGQIINTVVSKMSKVHRYELVRLIPALKVEMPNESTKSDEFALFDAVRSLIYEMSKIQPLVLFMDDFHYADTSTIELVQYLARNLVDTKVMILLSVSRFSVSGSSFTNQPIQAFMSSVKRDVDYLPVHLSNLDEITAQKAIMFHLAPHKAAPLILNKIYELTKGNPLFINEVVRYLKEKQVLKEVSGAWVLNAERIEFPPTINDTIKKIMDQSTAELSDILNVAAVIGSEFSLDAIRNIVNLPVEQVVSFLDELISMQIISDIHAEYEETYKFNHNIVREVYYQELSQVKKRHIHRDYATYLEEKHKDNIEPYCETLADHFFNGKDLEKALKYCIMSGEKSKDYYANKSALTFFYRALQIIDGKLPKDNKKKNTLAVKLDILVKIAYIKSQLLEYNGLRDVLDQIHPILGQIESESHYVHYQLLEGLYYYGQSQFEECLKWTNLAISGFKRLDEPEYESLAIRTIGNVLNRKNDYKLALERYFESKELSEKRNDPKGAIKSAVNISLVYLYQGQYESSLEIIQSTLNNTKKMQDSRTEAVAIGSLAMVYQHIGLYDKAVEHYSKAIELLYKIDDMENLSIHLANIGNTYHELLEYGDAINNFEKALEIAEKLNQPNITVALKNDYTRLLIESIEFERADEFVQSCIKTAEEYNLSNDLILAYHNQARLLLARGKFAEAEIISDRVQRISAQLQVIEDGIPEIWLTHYEILMKNDKKVLAKEYLEKAYEYVINTSKHIVNEEFKNSFLNKVKLNSKIIKLMSTEY